MNENDITWMDSWKYRFKQILILGILYLIIFFSIEVVIIINIKEIDIEAIFFFFLYNFFVLFIPYMIYSTAIQKVGFTDTTIFLKNKRHDIKHNINEIDWNRTLKDGLYINGHNFPYVIDPMIINVLKEHVKNTSE